MKHWTRTRGFGIPSGDLISLLVVFSEYERACRSGGERTFARKHSLRDRALRFARKARDQLDAELARCERRENKRRRESSDGSRVDLGRGLSRAGGGPVPQRGRTDVE